MEYVYVVKWFFSGIDKKLHNRQDVETYVKEKVKGAAVQFLWSESGDSGVVMHGSSKVAVIKRFKK